MDIINRLSLWAARQPRTEGAQLVLEAVNVIEALRREARTQQQEIAKHLNIWNALLEMDRLPEMNPNGVEDFK